MNPIIGIKDGITIVRCIEGVEKSVDDKVFVEVGTGRTIIIPITLWLCGASRIITVDLNPYLKNELIQEELNFIRCNKDAVLKMFGNSVNQKQFNERFDTIVRGKLDINGFMKESQIEYIAPSDARKLHVCDKTIDYHISNNVFEHVPLEVMSQILSEGKRMLKDDGLMVHRIDFSDHFSHSDHRIPTINFLQYSEEQWLRYAGNRYMYHNRARIDEFEEIMENAGLKIIDKKLEIDQNAVRLIKSGLKLDKRFAGKPDEINSVLNDLVVATKV
ncbi:MAG: class I SAM-dependent methyltransferase [Acidobacteria bacterium]|nr:class I SAM-dependent methyltransferase [Acidobacteriota bacterium]